GQSLKKGVGGWRERPRPLAAADMVLVRLAYAADLPSPADLARRLQDGAGTGAAPASAGGTPKPSRKPVHAEAEVPPPAFDRADDENPEPREVAPQLKSFEDVVALAEAKRDLKLKHALLEQVRLVHFKPGNIGINPLPQAPRGLGRDLMGQLKGGLGRRGATKGRRSLWACSAARKRLARSRRSASILQ